MILINEIVLYRVNNTQVYPVNMDYVVSDAGNSICCESQYHNVFMLPHIWETTYVISINLQRQNDYHDIH